MDGFRNTTKDEDNVVMKLFGRNEVPTAEIHNWTHYFCVNFPGLDPTKLIKTYHPRVLDGVDLDALNNKVKKQFDNRQPLSNLEFQHHGSRFHKPFAVSVVAKKQIELVVHGEGTVLVFGRIMVADETGVCGVKFVNTAVRKCYNHIQVGDRLVIGNGSVEDRPPPDENTIFSTQPSFQPFLIKISNFDCYHVHRIKETNVFTPWPNFLLAEKKLWTPSSLADDPRGLTVVEALRAVDVIGVISHVSRLERQRRYESRAVIVKGHREELQDFTQFDVSCWVQLVDLDSKGPLSIKLRLSSLLWDKRSDLVPGSLVVLTHVEPGDMTYAHPHLQSSPYSEVFVNTQLFDYVRIMGQKSSFVKVTGKFVGLVESSNILKRKDVTWSVGGAYVVPIMDSTKFFLRERFPFRTIPKMPLCRRESQQLVFKAYLLRYNLFQTEWDNDFEAWLWSNNEALKRDQLKKRNIRTIYDPIPVHTRNTSLWDMFTRRLPAFDFEFPVSSHGIGDKDTLSCYLKAAERWKQFVTPISMPAGMGKELKKLAVIDGAPHYAVDLWNLEGEPGLERIIMTWKPSQIDTIVTIQKKLKALENHETVLVVAEVYRAESLELDEKFGHQFIVHDILPPYGSEQPAPDPPQVDRDGQGD